MMDFSSVLNAANIVRKLQQNTANNYFFRSPATVLFLLGVMSMTLRCLAHENAIFILLARNNCIKHTTDKVIAEIQ